MSLSHKVCERYFFSDRISDVLLYRLATHICAGEAETFFCRYFDYSSVEVSNAMHFVSDELDIGKIFRRWHQQNHDATIEEFEELLNECSNDIYAHKETIQTIRDTIEGKQHVIISV